MMRHKKSRRSQTMPRKPKAKAPKALKDVDLKDFENIADGTNLEPSNDNSCHDNATAVNQAKGDDDGQDSDAKPLPDLELSRLMMLTPEQYESVVFSSMSELDTFLNNEKSFCSENIERSGSKDSQSRVVLEWSAEELKQIESELLNDLDCDAAAKPNRTLPNQIAAGSWNAITVIKPNQSLSNESGSWNDITRLELSQPLSNPSENGSCYGATGLEPNQELPNQNEARSWNDNTVTEPSQPLSNPTESGLWNDVPGLELKQPLANPNETVSLDDITVIELNQPMTNLNKAGSCYTATGLKPNQALSNQSEARSWNDVTDIEPKQPLSNLNKSGSWNEVTGLELKQPLANKNLPNLREARSWNDVNLIEPNQPLVNPSKNGPWNDITGFELKQPLSKCNDTGSCDGITVIEPNQPLSNPSENGSWNDVTGLELNQPLSNMNKAGSCYDATGLEPNQPLPNLREADRFDEAKEENNEDSSSSSGESNASDPTPEEVAEFNKLFYGNANTSNLSTSDQFSGEEDVVSSEEDYDSYPVPNLLPSLNKINNNSDDVGSDQTLGSGSQQG